MTTASARQIEIPGHVVPGREPGHALGVVVNDDDRDGYNKDLEEIDEAERRAARESRTITLK